MTWTGGAAGRGISLWTGGVGGSWTLTCTGGDGGRGGLSWTGGAGGRCGVGWIGGEGGRCKLDWTGGTGGGAPVPAGKGAPLASQFDAVGFAVCVAGSFVPTFSESLMKPSPNTIRDFGSAAVAPASSRTFDPVEGCWMSRDFRRSRILLGTLCC